MLHVWSAGVTAAVLRFFTSCCSGPDASACCVWCCMCGALAWLQQCEGCLHLAVVVPTHQHVACDVADAAATCTASLNVTWQAIYWILCRNRSPSYSYIEYHQLMCFDTIVAFATPWKLQCVSINCVLITCIRLMYFSSLYFIHKCICLSSWFHINWSLLFIDVSAVWFIRIKVPSLHQVSICLVISRSSHV